jgi:hypothetical protein
MTRIDSRIYRSYRTPHSTSVMFSAHFADGRTAYFVIQGHGGGEEDHKALAVAQERQRTGELPEGTIRTVKRVR